jgi:DNA-binding NtrC family response regulator
MDSRKRCLQAEAAHGMGGTRFICAGRNRWLHWSGCHVVMPIERILILEDDLVLRKLLETQLRQAGYEVFLSATLANARELLLKESLDVVIADVGLPDGDGTQVLQSIPSKPGGPMVIMISGQGSVESALECMKQGAFDYLIKPFTPQQLEVCLCRASEVSQLMKVNRFLSSVPQDDVPSEWGDGGAPGLASKGGPDGCDRVDPG